MQHKTRRSRARIALVGALIGGIFSAGAMTESASAAKKVQSESDTTIVVQIDTKITTMSMRSGIRW